MTLRCRRQSGIGEPLLPIHVPIPGLAFGEVGRFGPIPSGMTVEGAADKVAPYSFRLAGTPEKSFLWEHSATPVRKFHFLAEFPERLVLDMVDFLWR
jgi:hypothetical protein